jgi:hypothetical protein
MEGGVCNHLIWLANVLNDRSCGNGASATGNREIEIFDCGLMFWGKYANTEHLMDDQKSC